METTNANDLCRQMDEVRCNLGEGVDEIVESAQTLTDWRHYVKSHPWMCLAGAAAIGFLMVPKRMVVVSPSADVLEEIMKRNKVVVKPDPKPSTRSGIYDVVFGMLANAAIRGVATYVGNNAESFFGSAVSKGEKDEKSNC